MMDKYTLVDNLLEGLGGLRRFLSTDCQFMIVFINCILTCKMLHKIGWFVCLYLDIKNAFNAVNH